MKALIIAAGLLLAWTSAATAATPQHGTREGDIACAGLASLAFRGASASKPPVPQVVAATAAAYGFYMGRLSKAQPLANNADITQAVAKLTNDEKNAYGNACLKQAGAMIQPKS